MAVIFGPTTWQEGVRVSQAALGSSVAGGRLICKSGGVGWIVAPSSTEVSTSWYCRNDAVTTAQSTSGCTGWFVPTCDQLKNPGSTCRTYWDSYSSLGYWSITESPIYGMWLVYINNGNTNNLGKPTTRPVRVFRCVTY